MSQLCSTSRCRNGLSLIELLVVIAIIGILIALMLPAVQIAREQARRSQCQSHLHQLAIAMESYHTDFRRFPTGVFRAPDGIGRESKSWSFLATLLPRIEQENLHRASGVPSKSLVESGISQNVVPLFLCPSDPFSASGLMLTAGDLEGFPVGQTNYKAVMGANWGADGSQKLEDIRTEWRNPSFSGSFDGLDDGDGPMFRSDFKKPRGHKHIKDGASNTFLLGEVLPDHDHWTSWPYANNAYATCAIPPNHEGGDPRWWPNAQSFRSKHPGGLYFAFCDGSVRFINEHIQLKTYRALATIRGGEVIDDAANTK